MADPPAPEPDRSPAPMRLGISPSASTRGAVEELAALAVEGGLDTLWLGDGYLDNADFALWAGGLENLTHLAWLAGRFPAARIGSTALVLPLRDPAWVAKQVTTLDQLTAGRYVAVVAPGFWPGEFAHRGLDFARRGERFDEHLDALIAAIRGEPFSGPHVELPAEGRLSPEPWTPGGPPIWLAGGDPTMAKALARGLPFQASRRTPAQLAPLARRWFDAGGTQLAVRIRLQAGDAPAAGTDVDWQAVTGPASALVDALGAYAELGVSDLSIVPGQSDVVSRRTVEVLVGEVLPQLGW